MPFSTVSFTVVLAAFVKAALPQYTMSISPQALNPQLTNMIGDNGGPTLYYNGSGPVPPYNMSSPVPVPFTPYTSTSTLEDYFYNEIAAIVSDTSYYTTNCSKCVAATEVMHLAAISQPVSTITDLLIRICNLTHFPIYAVTCEAAFSGVGGLGPYWAQLLAKMSMATGDMQAFCYYNYVSSCPRPPTVQIDESKWFSPKPPSASVVPTPSGKTINVLHLSDWHLDPRYDIGSEANCSQYLCCRPYSTNTKLKTSVNNASVPASRFGYFYCDSPADLALSTFTTMDQFIKKSDVAFTVFTGDIVSHDNDDQLSRAYVEYEESVTYAVFKAAMGNSPIYPTLGNHDSLPEAFNTPNNINGGNNGTNNTFSWNYNLLSSMWAQDGWINATEQQFAATHYGAYAHTTAQGLRIISLNSDFWYVDNIFNYFNFTNPDQSGIFSFLISELEACEAKGQRSYVIAHVPTGYDGSQSLTNPSALFYSIVRRFSPATIAAVFFGHTHEDQIQIFYDYAPTSVGKGANSTIRNTTDVDYNAPIMMGFMGPSITPLTGLNAGYQVLQVDSNTFDVMGIQTYFANISESLTWKTPVWQFEYDARTVYNVNGTWPKTSPLNATFYNNLANAMLTNQTLVEQYNKFETKSSVTTKNCTSAACARQKVCYIKSGSAALGYNCPYGNGPF